MSAITRFAPTPSGYLHAGNLLNLDMVLRVAREARAELALRIDDADASRYRREYAEDVFRVLRARGVGWQHGPRDVDDFEARHSQRARTAYYRSELDLARDTLECYACGCSRADQMAAGRRGCVSGCRDAALPLRAGVTALRAAVPAGTTVVVAGAGIDLEAAMGDFVLWRRDGLPAYQLVSVIEDRDLGTTHIVRGEDLLPSTAAQCWLAPHLRAPNVAAATYVHHRLVAAPDGTKLSKSTVTPTG